MILWAVTYGMGEIAQARIEEVGAHMTAKNLWNYSGKTGSNEFLYNKWPTPFSSFRLELLRPWRVIEESGLVDLGSGSTHVESRLWDAPSARNITVCIWADNLCTSAIELRCVPYLAPHKWVGKCLGGPTASASKSGFVIMGAGTTSHHALILP